MTNERWRCFVALPISDDLRHELGVAVDRWRPRHDLAGLRWMPSSGWHVTLAFLGDLPPSRVPEIERTLVGVAARHEPMSLTTGGLGGFPRPQAAKVAWYGVDGAARRVSALAGDVAAALGMGETRPFHPHLTLARAVGAPADLRAWISDGGAPDGTLAVDRMLLMRSHLGRQGATYETLASITLRGSSDG